nr:MAG TPA: hypothetical protein [Caudoviricetes sp.]
MILDEFIGRNCTFSARLRPFVTCLRTFSNEIF